MISAETLAALRGVAQNIIGGELKTEVTVLRRSRSAENAFGTSGETWAGTDTYMAWVREIRATDLNNLNKQAGMTNEVELRLPINAIVDVGDRVVIGGDLWVVNNTNNVDTLPIFMKATVRKIE